MRPLFLRSLLAPRIKHIIQYDRARERDSSKLLPRAGARRCKSECVCVCVYTRACVLTSAYLSPRYASLIFISKNFFNKKVTRARAPLFTPPSSPSDCCSGGFSYRQVCVSYIRGRRESYSARGLATGPRIKSFARRSAIFHNFPVFRKSGRPPRPVETVRTRARACGYDSHTPFRKRSVSSAPIVFLNPTERRRAPPTFVQRQINLSSEQRKL